MDKVYGEEESRLSEGMSIHRKHKKNYDGVGLDGTFFFFFAKFRFGGGGRFYLKPGGFHRKKVGSILLKDRNR